MQVDVSISLVTIGCVRTPGAGGVVAEMRMMSSVADIFIQAGLKTGLYVPVVDATCRAVETCLAVEADLQVGLHTFSNFTRNPLYSGANEFGSTTVGVTRLASDP